MKVLLINGSPHPNGCTYTALREAAGALESEGIETEIFRIGNKPIRGCIACGGCGSTGVCVFNDEAVEAAEKIAAADGLIVGSPVYYAGANGSLLALLDRVFYFAGSRFAGKPAAAVVSARRAGTTSALDQINKYFGISRMPVVSSQYWNMVHGSTPDEVRRDAEGLQIMRTLGRNMAWLIKSIEAGKKAGILPPEPEPRHEWTNFIR